MIERLNWDSDFFQKEIGTVHPANSEIFENTLNFDLIIANQNENFPLKIEGFENTFQETKINYIKNLNASKHEISADVLNTDLIKKDINFFKNLAFESGKYSRFKLDKRFGGDEFQKLYLKWIENTLNKKFSDKIFFLEEKGIATGFVTIKKSTEITKIGLIAIHPNFQRRGLGKILLQSAENYCIENGLKFLEITTQQSNIEASQFYEKFGYIIKDRTIIKHYWKKY